MSLGTWDPTAGPVDSDTLLTDALIARLVGYGRDDTLHDLESAFTDLEKQTLAGIMRLDPQLWQDAAAAMEDEDILQLIRCLAVAENLPGWEAGAKSPVIPLAKILRSRGRRLDKDMLRWLRQVSDNRFLPYGPL